MVKNYIVDKNTLLGNNNLQFNDDYSFGYSHSLKAINSEDIQEIHILHSHSDIYEVLMLVNGNLEFHVEGSIYRPEQYDILIVTPSELHKLVSYGNSVYERHTLHISSDFFLKNNCMHFKSVFDDKVIGTQNLIPSDIVKKDILDAILRLEKHYYNNEFLVANAVLVEILYYLNNTKNTAPNPVIKNDRISKIIVYINNCITEDITIELLSKKFFIDKYYLCKIFKKNTGYTINQYINFKRLLFALDLRSQGMSLTNSSIGAGFKSYSSFYKIHVKYMGVSPRKK